VGLQANAIMAGQRHYFTGKPCSNGHISLRVSQTAHCMECQRMHRCGKGRPQSRTMHELIAMGMTWAFWQSKRLWREQVLR
jgi:alkylhydroperoxidase family enzyme